MHPLLNEHANPLCRDQMDALKACHEAAGYWGKVLGQCNAEKADLDVCFRTQKKATRKVYLEEARAERARWREACTEFEQGK